MKRKPEAAPAPAPAPAPRSSATGAAALSRGDALFLERLAEAHPKAAAALSALARALALGEALPRTRFTADRPAWQAFYRAAAGMPPAGRDFWAALFFSFGAPLTAVAALESALARRHPAAGPLVRLGLHLQAAHELRAPFGAFARYTLATEGIELGAAGGAADETALHLPRPVDSDAWVLVWDKPGVVLAGLAPAQAERVALAAVAYPEYARRKPPELWIAPARVWLPLDAEQFLLAGGVFKRAPELAARLDALENESPAPAAAERALRATARRLVELGAPPAALDAVEAYLGAAAAPGKRGAKRAAAALEEAGEELVNER